LKSEHIFQAFTGLAALEGILAVGLYFTNPPRAGETLVAGYSTSRLLGGLGLALVLVFFLVLFAGSFIWKERLKTWGTCLKDVLNADAYRLILAVPVFFALAVNLLGLCVYFIPATRWALPIIRTYALIQVVGERIYLAQLWAVLILIKGIVFYFILNKRDQVGRQRLSGLAQAAIVSWSLTACVLALSLIWGLVSRDLRLQLMSGPTFKLLALSIWFSLWVLGEWKNSRRAQQVRIYFWMGTVWLVVFLLSLQLAHSLNIVVNPRESYWHLLADSFLHGRLYLLNPPSDQDLVFYNGRWYIPIPPLPAFIMLPLVAVFGVKAINTTIVSLCLAATTAALVFLILDEMRRLTWIKLSLGGQLWLVALFSFGTVHLWLSVVSRVWYFSQVCAVFFAALAFFSALKKRPAWLTGLCLGLALLARPNLFTLWPALLAIAIQLQIAQTGKFDWKKSLTWALFSALPVIAAVGFLLYYNYLRFGNFLDFGYTAISSGGTVVSDARQFGIFSLHFVWNNVQTMFLSLPDLEARCGYFLPRGHGISMLAATPAVLYLFRRLKIFWWTVGCWLAILLSMGLLATYHNDGSIQYAYRYLIDFILPVIMLLALNTGQKVSWPLRVLIIISMAMNYFGTVSWFFSKC
jgi:hypothetical protein